MTSTVRSGKDPPSCFRRCSRRPPFAPTITLRGRSRRARAGVRLGGDEVHSPLLEHWRHRDARPRLRSALLLVAPPAKSFFDAETMVDSIRHVVRRAGLEPAFEVKVTGMVSMFHDLDTSASDDLLRAERIGVPLTMLVLLLVFGAPIAAALPLLIALGATVLTLAVLYAVSHVMPVSVFAQNAVTMIGLGVGVDYALFLVSRCRGELNAGKSWHDAVEIADTPYCARRRRVWSRGVHGFPRLAARSHSVSSHTRARRRYGRRHGHADDADGTSGAAASSWANGSTGLGDSRSGHHTAQRCGADGPGRRCESHGGISCRRSSCSRCSSFRRCGSRRGPSVHTTCRRQRRHGKATICSWRTSRPAGWRRSYCSSKAELGRSRHRSGRLRCSRRTDIGRGPTRSDRARVAERRTSRRVVYARFAFGARIRRSDGLRSRIAYYRPGRTRAPPASVSGSAASMPRSSTSMKNSSAA